MDWENVEKIMRERGFTLTGQSVDAENVGQSITQITTENPTITSMTFQHKPQKDVDIAKSKYIPRYNCTVYDDGSCRFSGWVCSTICYELRTLRFMRFDDEQQFNNVRSEYEQKIKALC